MAGRWMTLLLLLFAVGNAGAQSNLKEWEEYLRQNQAENYVSYFYKDMHGRSNSIACYSFNGKSYLIQRMERKLVFAEPGGEDVFQLVRKELQGAKYLKRRLNNRRGFKQMDKAANSGKKGMSIKYGSLHFNHYVLKTDEELGLINNKKARQAYIALNELAAALLKHVK